MRFTREYPVNIKQQDKNIFKTNLKIELPEPEILTINNVKITTEGYLIKNFKLLSYSWQKEGLKRGNWNNLDELLLYFLRENYYEFDFLESQYLKGLKKNINKLGWSLKPFLKDPFFMRTFLLKNKIKINKRAVWCTDEYTNNYYHWFSEALPRLYHIYRNTQDFVLLLPNILKEKEYVKKSLLPFKIDDIRYIDENEIIETEELIIPRQFSPHVYINDNITNSFRYFLINKLKENLPKVDKGNKIYISRAGAEKRKITNEKELFPILEDHNFDIVQFEKFDWEKQVSMANNADYLVGLHGAGLTNMLFMEPGSSVLELNFFIDEEMRMHYFHLASALDIDYYYQIGQTVENPQKQDDVYINPDEFEKTLKFFIS